MTLTACIPSLRRTLPDPLAIDRWPEYTTASTTDVTIAGVSLLRLVDWCGTPCVHTAAAVIPGTNGRPSDTELASVTVTRVQSVASANDGGLVIEVDADLRGCRGVLSEVRLIGRASVAHTVSVRVPMSEGMALALPGDVHPGDLIAVPCLGVTRRHDVVQEPLETRCGK